jgi:predicted nucleic acid-binding protein
MRAYLDSSAIVKRYIKENGSESVDIFFNALEKEGEEEEQPKIDSLIFSSWNLGEVYGAIDARHQRGDIGSSAMVEALFLFTQEIKKFVAMRKVGVIPIGTKTLTGTRELILKYHIYQADALQLASATQARAELFVSADRRLIECAKLEQLKALNPEKDYNLIQKTLAKKGGE